MVFATVHSGCRWHQLGFAAIPIGSMEMVHLPIDLIDFHGKCWYINIPYMDPLGLSLFSLGYACLWLFLKMNQWSTPYSSVYSLITLIGLFACLEKETT